MICTFFLPLISTDLLWQIIVIAWHFADCSFVHLHFSFPLCSALAFYNTSEKTNFNRYIGLEICDNTFVTFKKIIKTPSSIQIYHTGAEELLIVFQISCSIESFDFNYNLKVYSFILIVSNQVVFNEIVKKFLVACPCVMRIGEY